VIARRLAAAILAGWVVAGCVATPSGQGPPTPLPPQPACAAADDPDSLCIVVLGDSIGVGVPVQGDDRWWVRLGAALAAALPDRRVIVDDWAVSGSRVDVLGSIGRDQPGLATYDLAIVIEGVNDQPVTSIDDWRPRYEAAISAIEQQGPVVIVATPPPGFENGSFITRYDPTAAALREIAGDRRPLLDIAARWHADGAAVAAAYYVDIVHQSAAGQAVMADMAREVILQVIGTL
jgi:lysophospholipase L1-like esterase